MPYATFADDKEYLFSKYRTPVFDPTTGLDNDQIIEALDKLAEEVDPLPRPIGKARCFEFICKNMAIDVNPHDCFPFFACWDRNQRPMRKSISRWAHQVFEKRITGDKALADVDSYNRNVAGITTTWVDFDHSVPDWDAIISLGFPGLRDRAR
ncbi:MAG: hypothetical protein J5833_03530, partial [Victivallales bacterium]|nr:hypothetical protein [Victivallales bacterium]